MNTDDLWQKKWYGGQLLAFSGLDGDTRYESSLVAITSYASTGIQIKLPEQLSVSFSIEHEKTLMASDYFEIHGIDLAGTSQVIKGGFIDSHHLLIHAQPSLVPSSICQDCELLNCKQEGDHILLGVKAHWNPQLLNTCVEQIRSNRLAWYESLQLPEFDNSMRRRTLARAVCVMKTQVMKAEGHIKYDWSTPDRWPHRSMWLWDSAFHAIGWRHLDPSLAMQMLQAVLSQQEDDGFIPHMSTPDWHSEITQPPVLCMAAWLLKDFGAETKWYEKIYPLLTSYVQWDLHNRDTDADGLVEWKIHADLNCRSGESGMDNSTRFDSPGKLAAVDFNSYLSLECELLSAMALMLGKPDEASHWDTQAKRLSQLIQDKLYDESSGFFYDMDTTTERKSPVMACSGFLPLICKKILPETRKALLKHIDNPQTFGTAFPIASVISGNGEYCTDMWRGPTWICINWLIAFGLDRHGYKDQANNLRQQTIREIENWFEIHGTFFEYYDNRGELSPVQLMRKGKTLPPDHPDPFPHQAIRDYGWTATLYVDMVLNHHLSR